MNDTFLLPNRRQVLIDTIYNKVFISLVVKTGDS